MSTRHVVTVYKVEARELAEELAVATVYAAGENHTAAFAAIVLPEQGTLGETLDYIGKVADATAPVDVAQVEAFIDRRGPGGAE